MQKSLLILLNYLLMLSVQEPRYYFGFKCTTVQKDENQIKKTHRQSKRLNMLPSGYAKILKPLEKLGKIIGDILLHKNPHQKQQQMVLNPLVEYFIFRIIAYDFITPQFKLTSYKQIMKNMFEGAIRSFLPGDKRDEKALKKIMFSELVKAFDAIFQNYLKDGKLPRWKPQQNRAKLLQQYEKVCLLSKENNKKSYLKIVENYLKQMRPYNCKRDYSISTDNNIANRKTYFFEQLNEIQIERFVQAEFEEVGKVQVLNERLQLSRLKQYAQKNKGYFNFQFFQINKKNAQPIYSLQFDAISKEKEPILLTFQDYLDLRQENCNYQEESQRLVVDLFAEIHKYRNSIMENTKESAAFYHYLSPTNAIIDQLSLSPKLSFLPCVQDAFGMKVRPHSIELKLAFSNTPQTFDYFQSQKQLSKDISILLKDPFYGTEFAFSETQVDSIKKAKQENKNLALVYQSICIDRFLLLSHQILKGNPFGKSENKTTNKLSKEYFLKKLSKQKKSISVNIKGLSTFLGQRLVHQQMQGDSFHFTLVELTEILNKRPQDSQILKHRFHRFYNLSAKRHVIIREITAIMNMKNRQFTKMTKPKKYLFMLFIFFLQLLFQYMFIYKSARRNQKDLVQIYEYLNFDKDARVDPYIGLSKNIQMMRDKVKNSTNKNGEDRQDTENKMIKRYGQAIAYITTEKDKISKLYKSIKQGESNKQVNLKQYLQLSYQQAAKRSEQFKDFFFQFLFPELNVRYANGPHSLGIRGSQQLEAGKQVTRRFELIIYSFMTSTEQNFMIYDSLVFPALRIRKEDIHKQHIDMVEMIQVAKNDQEKDKMLHAGRYILNQVDDILDFTIELPNIYKRLRVPMGKWFIENDRSFSTNQLMRTEQQQQQQRQPQQQKQPKQQQAIAKRQQLEGKGNLQKRQM